MHLFKMGNVWNFSLKKRREAPEVLFHTPWAFNQPV
jgi:hypothetical protein